MRLKCWVLNSKHVFGTVGGSRDLGRGWGSESIQQQMERSKNENHGSEYRGNTLKFKCFLTRGNQFLQRY